MTLQCVCVCSVAQLYLTPCDPMECNLPDTSLPGKNTGVGCHFLLQGIFPTQGLNPCLLRLLALPGRFFTTEPPRKPQQPCTSKVCFVKS